VETTPEDSNLQLVHNQLRQHLGVRRLDAAFYRAEMECRRMGRCTERWMLVVGCSMFDVGWREPQPFTRQNPTEVSLDKLLKSD